MELILSGLESSMNTEPGTDCYKLRHLLKLINTAMDAA